MNYSPRVTANCDGSLLIELANKPDTVAYLIYLDQDGDDQGMIQVADIPAQDGPVTIYHHLPVVPNTGQASVTAVAANQTGGSSIANSTVLAFFDDDPLTPAFKRGFTYQYGLTATGTECPGSTPPTSGTSTPAPVKGGGKGPKKN